MASAALAAASLSQEKQPMGAQIPQEWDNQVVIKTKYATGWRGGQGGI